MNNEKQLNCMLADIKQAIEKHTDNKTSSTITLEKDKESGKIQVIIKIKNISEMKISFK
ncbi:hypothetical protein NMD51_23150 (plasmid) [Escherichia coli]|jgi:hypothetical protein|uniref:hypothetical protein n=1 Tax=Escherichia TaxID=561 RepID=UPI000B0CF437|nr:hypothetical protein [Escherichia coli]EFM0433219.1 hypothetical protein [Escherichia coli]EHP6490440.1 hypothetical protein [Escherichia coli]EHP6514620.1 hypothetical protein [Escherichia coli]EHP7228134.1 hypothetical protein [Escherichia coli]EHZ4808613.1 hypothetical protein [Escherichia coli]